MLFFQESYPFGCDLPVCLVAGGQVLFVLPERDLFILVIMIGIARQVEKEFRPGVKIVGSLEMGDSGFALIPVFQDGCEVCVEIRHFIRNTHFNGLFKLQCRFINLTLLTVGKPQEMVGVFRIRLPVTNGLQVKNCPVKAVQVQIGYPKQHLEIVAGITLFHGSFYSGSYEVVVFQLVFQGGLVV